MNINGFKSITGVVMDRDIPRVLGIAMRRCERFPPLFVVGNYKNNAVTEDDNFVTGQYVSLYGQFEWSEINALNEFVIDLRVDGESYVSMADLEVSG